MKRILLILLLLIPLVSAELVVNRYTNDFALSSRSNEQLKLCSCETLVDTVIIENTGQFYASYEIEIRSDYPRTIRAGLSSFTLAPKHFKEVPIYIEDSCGVEGVFGYTITAVNSYGRVEQLQRTIRADVCQAGSLEVSQTSDSIGLCRPATFTVTTRNVGTYPESFSYNFGPYTPELEAWELFLQPGQSHTQEATFTWPCTEHGERTVPFLLYAERTGLQASEERTITIQNQYDFALDLQTSAEVCALTTTRLPLSFENLAPVEDTITLTVSGPAAFPGGERELTGRLGSGQRSELQLEVPPSVPVGTHEVAITATDAHGGIAKSRTMALQVANCYDPAVEIRIAPDQPLTGMDVDCCGPKTYYANVQNDGDREQVFQLRLDGPSIFTLDTLSVRVRPSENVNVPIRADLPCTDEAYRASVTVWPQGQPQANATAELAVESWSERACYRVQIDEDELTVRDDASVVPVVVRHTGLRGGSYTLTSNSTIFGFRETGVELQPGEERAIHMVPSVNLSEQEKGRYIVLPTLTQEDMGIPYGEFLGVRLRGKDLFERFLDRIASISLAEWDLCARIALFLGIALLAAIVALLLIYAGKFTLFPDGLSRDALSIAKTTLILIGIVLLVTLAFLDVPPREATFERVAMGNATVLEWYQNEQLTIDLDVYFTDPDRDVLMYTASQPRDISAVIEDGALTLTPDHNFAGENSMVVTASDGKNLTDSPVFILRVIPRRSVGFVDWVELWCKHIIAILLLGMLLVLFLAVLTVRERRQDLRKDNIIVVVSPERRAPRKSSRRKRSRGTRSTARRRKTWSRTTATRSSAVAVRPEVITRERSVQGGAQANVQNIVNVPGAKAEEVALVGSRTGNTVHTPYCMIARRIPKAKRVAFSSKQEALRAGLVPCKGCRPF